MTGCVYTQPLLFFYKYVMQKNELMQKKLFFLSPAFSTCVSTKHK